MKIVMTCQSVEESIGYVDIAPSANSPSRASGVSEFLSRFTGGTSKPGPADYFASVKTGERKFEPGQNYEVTFKAL